MKILIAVLFLIYAASGCKSKKKEDEEKKIISVVSLLQSQAKHVDTSNYSIIRIIQSNGNRDTQAVSKQEFRTFANEFLQLPDISSKEKIDHYDVSKTYDSLLNNLVVTYMSNDPKEEITRETVLWGPDSLGNSQVRTIFINRLQDAGDGVTEKEMTWHMNRGFQIISKTQVSDQPENVQIVQVQWK